MKQQWGNVTLTNMPREQKLALYDSHNGTTRLSPDPQERLYGKCGCTTCVCIRSEIINSIPAPINTPHRNGSNNMAGINICDRCQSMVTGNALGVVQVRTSSDDRISEIIAKEICPACVGDLMVFIEETAVERRDVRAYKDPWKRPEEKKGATKSTAELLSGLIGESIDEAIRTRRLEIEGTAKAEPKTTSDDYYTS